MKHVILPTDFTIRSLQPIHDVMRYYSGQTVHFTLLHLVCLPTGIGDLLFRTSKIKERHPIPAAFLDACDVMANRYEDRITCIRPMIRHGETKAYLENLLCGMNADAVFIQQGVNEASTFRDSIAITPLLRRCKFKVIELTPAVQKESASVSTVGDLLLATN